MRRRERRDRHLGRADAPVLLAAQRDRDAARVVAAARVELAQRDDADADLSRARGALRHCGHEHVRILRQPRLERAAQRDALGRRARDGDRVLEVELGHWLGRHALGAQRLLGHAEQIHLHPHRAEAGLAQHLLVQMQLLDTDRQRHRGLERVRDADARLADGLAAVRRLDLGRRAVGAAARRRGAAQRDGLGLCRLAQLDGDGEGAGGLPACVLQRHARLLQQRRGEERRQRHLALPEHRLGVLLVLVEDREAQRLLLEVLGEIALFVDGEAEGLLEDRGRALLGVGLLLAKLEELEVHVRRGRA